LVHGGRDGWLGLVLIVLAALFGLRGVALEDSRRQRDAAQLREQLAVTVSERASKGLTPAARPTGWKAGMRRWLRRFAA
jgi:hypothetical protein